MEDLAELILDGLAQAHRCAVRDVDRPRERRPAPCATGPCSTQSFIVSRAASVNCRRWLARHRVA